MYPTRGMIFVALAGVPIALVAAIIHPVYWLVGPAWILFSIGVFAVDALAVAGGWRSTCTLDAPGAMGVGRGEDATLVLTFARGAPSSVEFAVDPATLIEIAPLRQHADVVSRAARARLRLHPIRRGQDSIANVWARWRGPLGLCWRQRRYALDKKISIVPDIATVKEEAVRLFQRESGGVGLRAQIRAGDGAEFNALREFHAGMDRRAIDWKQTARHAKLLAREYQAEENLHIVFALDTGRLMCEPLMGSPRIDRAIQAMLLLSFVALRLGDRVGLFAFDERPVLSSGTVAGPGAFSVLQRVAAGLDYSTAETNFTLGLTQLSAGLEHRSIVVVFTDFFDTTSAELMIENVKRLLLRHTVLFVTFRDEELETMLKAEPRAPADISRAVLADAMLRERENVTMRLRRLGVDVVDVPVEQIGPGLIEAYLSVKHARGMAA